VTLRKKLLLKTTQYSTSLEGAKDITTETRKKLVRLTILFADGMNFPLSTAYFTPSAVEENIAPLRDFLGFKQRKKDSKSPKSPRNSRSTPVPAPEKVDSENELTDSSDSEDNQPSDGNLDWDKAIDEWEAGVKERKVTHA
jgi:hypothetical protein